MSDIIYSLPRSLGSVVFTENAISAMLLHRQVKLLSKEAGGQLFAEIKEGCMRIIEVTGPRKKDKRSRFSFWPDRAKEQEEIKDRFSKSGLHYVGDWHTHPESIPSPSGSDARSVAEIMTKSRHDLPGILLVIVGTADIPGGLYVGFQTTDTLYELRSSTDGGKAV